MIGPTPICARARSRGRSRGRGRAAGFTLLEIVCVLAIVAMLAAVVLPHVPHSTSRPRLEAYALATAALLKADRNAAIRRGIPVATEVNAMARSIRSGATGTRIQVANDVAFDAVLPRYCNEQPARSTIAFFASGMSCGGSIALTRPGAGYDIRVNWLTGGVEVVTRNAP